VRPSDVHSQQALAGVRLNRGIVGDDASDASAQLRSSVASRTSICK